MLWVTQPSREQLERKKHTALTHAGQIPRGASAE